MTATSDDDYPPELDLDMTMDNERIAERIASSNENMNFIGPPPDSEADDEDDYQPCQNEPTLSDYTSSDGEFDVDAYQNIPYMGYSENKLMAEEMPELTNDLIVSGTDNNTCGIDFLQVGDPVDFLRVFLTSSLMGQPLKVNDGFDPEDLDKCCSELMGVPLITVGIVLLGAEMENLPNRSKTELAFALSRKGWLRENNSKFYPVMPESEKDFVLSLIVGAQKLHSYEENRKREAELFPSAEKEVKALITFNMIVELMNAIREEFRIRMLPYQTISNGYLDMVTGRKYPQIHKKYFQKLGLDETKGWNSTWFNAYTGRSTLKKFVQMARFSEIVVIENPPSSRFCFRADDENRPVRMFTSDDIKEVEEKWSSGNEINKNFGRNFGGGQGQRGGPRGAQQQPKKRIEEDPNYRSATLGGGISDDDDDGSLMPSTSTRENRAGPSTSTQPVYGRRSPSSSPVRNQRANRSSSVESRKSIPAPQQAYKPPNPFGGTLLQPRPAVNQNGNGNNRFDSRRLITFGASSSESEEESEGCYSDEGPEEREKKTKQRNEKKLRKEKRELERREKHRKEVPKPVVTSFQTRPFYNTKPVRPADPLPAAPENREEYEEPPAQQHRSPFGVSAPTPAPAPASVSPQSSSSNAPVNQDEEIVPPPPQVVSTDTLPLFLSKSTHNQEYSPAQMPYKPAEGVMEKNRAEEAERRRREELTEMRMKANFAHQTSAPAQVPATHPWMSGAPRPASSQQQVYGEPPVSSGFGNILPPPAQRIAPQQPPSSQQVPPLQQAPPLQMQQQQEPIYSAPIQDTYRGRNHQGTAPPQNYAQPAPSQQQYGFPPHQNATHQNPSYPLSSHQNPPQQNQSYQNPLYSQHQQHYPLPQQQYQQSIPANPYPMSRQPSPPMQPPQQPRQHQPYQDPYNLPSSRSDNHSNPQRMDDHYSSRRDSMRSPMNDPPRNNSDCYNAHNHHRMSMSQPQYSNPQRSYKNDYPPAPPFNHHRASPTRSEFNGRQNRNEPWNQVQPGEYNPYGNFMNAGATSSSNPSSGGNAATWFGRQAAANRGGGEQPELKQMKIEIMRIAFEYESDRHVLSLSDLKEKIVQKMPSFQFFDFNEFIRSNMRDRIVIVNGHSGPCIQLINP